MNVAQVGSGCQTASRFPGGQGFVHAQHRAAVAVEKGRDAVIGDAMHMHGRIGRGGEGGAELREIRLGGVFEIDGDVDVAQPQRGTACGLVGQGFFMGVQPEIDDMGDTQGGQAGELRFRGLAGGGDPAIEPVPVINAVWVAHGRQAIVRRG